MKTLIVEDDFASRKLMHKYVAPLGESDVVVDGEEALEAVQIAINEQAPYDLVCLDIMLPKKDGQEVLKELRKIEERHGLIGNKATKVIMTTALGDAKNVMSAFRSQCEAYLQKPISQEQLYQELRELKLLTGDDPR